MRFDCHFIKLKSLFQRNNTPLQRNNTPLQRNNTPLQRNLEETISRLQYAKSHPYNNDKNRHIVNNRNKILEVLLGSYKRELNIPKRIHNNNSKEILIV
jgi:hypothetical protein